MREDFYVPSLCQGILNQDGERISGETIIVLLQQCMNGLMGRWFCIMAFTEFSELYAFTSFMMRRIESEVEEMLRKKFSIEKVEFIPVRASREINDYPLFKRYFLRFKGEKSSEEDEVVQMVMDINVQVEGAYVISSGKNMGIFKGIGYPEDIGRFFRLEEYEGHCWIAHGRFPTNSVGWWGGAHPFGLLSWS